MAAPITLALLLVVTAGCGVRREVRVTSEPSGALVYLNDREVGRTPVAVPFELYGHYDVTLRKEGYATRSTQRWLLAPWWQVPPIDLLAELAPWRPVDVQRVHLRLAPAETVQDPAALVQRAEALRERL